MALTYILGIPSVLIAIWIVVDRVRFRRLQNKRIENGLNREQFVEAFRKCGIQEFIPSTVYDYYGSQATYKNFPLTPDDSFFEVLSDDPDDLDKDACTLLDLLGMKLPPEGVRREFGNRPIKTLREMVIWLDWVQQHQATRSRQRL